jgi:phosphate starvation-inducible membrane PsiE
MACHFFPPKSCARTACLGDGVSVSCCSLHNQLNHDLIHVYFGGYTALIRLYITYEHSDIWFLFVAGNSGCFLVLVVSDTPTKYVSESNIAI